LSHGGHLTHGSPVNFQDVCTPSFYGVERETGRLDYDKIQEIAIKNSQNDHCRSFGIFAWIFERFRVIADSVGAILLADISHPSGLIAKGLLNDPIPHCRYNYHS
jgi:glycine hydroxymethyltransferase